LNTGGKIEHDAGLEKNARCFDWVARPVLLLKGNKLFGETRGNLAYLENGFVKDADFDEEALIERILPKEGYRAIFVEKVV
jgi:hypothetical protein